MAQIEFVDKLPSELISEAENLNEIPNKIRFLVEGAPNVESKIATLEKFYDKIEMHPTQKGNFIVSNEDGEKLVVDNKNKTNLGDLIDISKELTEVAGSAIGTAIGAGAGTVAATPGVGTAAGAIVGSGAGMAVGAELYERVAQQFGTEILRTNKEHAAQRMTDFAFGSIGQAVAPLILKGVKGSLVGFGKSAVGSRERLKAFIDAGVSPTLGQVSQKRSIQTVELVLGNFPGSSGRIAAHALKAQDDLGEGAFKLAKNLINKKIPASEVEVGRLIKNSIKNGVNASDGFVGRFHSKSGVLFGELDKYLKPKQGIKLDKTLTELRSIVTPIKGAEKTSAIFKNTFLDDILKGLEGDLAKGGGTLPYQAVKSIKNQIGKKLASFDLINPVDKSQLKRIYSLLSQDIQLALRGNKKALKALSNANKYYKTGLQRIENFLEPIIKTADPDRIVSVMLNSAKEGASRINALKKSLTPNQYKVFLSSVVDRLGRIQPAQALGGEFVEGTGKFSSETFLTNWARLSKESKTVLFEGKGWGKEMIKDFNDIINVSSIIRQSGKTFKNPSGTADRVVGQGIVLGGGATAFTGNPVFLVGVLSAIGGANVTSRLFTNPSFIKWLAAGTKISATKGIDGILTHLAKLGVVMGNADSESRQFIHEYFEMLMGRRKKDEANVVPKSKSSSVASLSNTPSNVEIPNIENMLASNESVLDTPNVNVASLQPNNTTMNQDYNNLSSLEKDKLLRGIS